MQSEEELSLDYSNDEEINVENEIIDENIIQEINDSENLFQKENNSSLTEDVNIVENNNDNQVDNLSQNTQEETN